jgi:phosphoribosylamine--glycine ligase
VITGLEEATRNGSVIIHAGTSIDAHGNVISAGGRVLAVVGLGEDIAEARDQAYSSIAEIRLDGSFYRRDIAAAAAQLVVS